MKERWRIVLLLAASISVYANTLVNKFAYDDELYIFRNPGVSRPTLTQLFQATRFGNVFRPLTFATLALNWAVGHGRPFGYHVVNVLLHAAVTLLLYFVLQIFLASVPRGSTIALVAALVYAVHPIHTEAVAWITGRSELLAAGFLLAAWLLHLEDRAVPALLCFLLAMMSKESAIVFVPLVVIGDYARGKLEPVMRYGWIAGMGALYLALLWKAQGGRFGEKGFNPLDNPLASFPVKWRILNALRIAWKYIGLHFYPATLSCDYSYNAILLYANWKRTLPAALAAAVVLGLWIWTVRTRRCGWILAGGIYLGAFAVTSNVLLSTGTLMGERLAYLPSAGFCLLVALVWIELEQRKATLAWGVLAIVLVALATRTVVRNRDWRDNYTLFLAAVQAVPQNTKAHANLGAVYLQRGELDKATTELETALRIFPNFPEAIEYKGQVEARRNHDREARDLFAKALFMTTKNNIGYDAMAVNLAEEMIRLGQDDDALKMLDETIAKSPGVSRAWSNRAAIRYQRGEIASARSDAETALRLDPSNGQAHALLNQLNAPAGATSTP
jgi:protein O-mannosyl-transferase